MNPQTRLTRVLCPLVALLLSSLLLPPAALADVPAPQITQFQAGADGSVLLNWDATPECAYRVLTATNLTNDPWVAMDSIAAASNTVTWQANGQGGGARFYRLATDAIAIQTVEPSIIPTGTVVTLYVIGQGFGSNDTLRLIGPGGPLALTNRIIIKPTLMSIVIGPSFTPDVPGDYDLEVTSGSTGRKATLAYAWSLVSRPAGSVALLEPPRPPVASPGFDIQEGRKGINAVNVKLALVQEIKAEAVAQIPSGHDFTEAQRRLPVRNLGSSGQDGVQLHSGEVQLEEVDMFIPGRGVDFIWARTYRSLTGSASPTGTRWTHSYDISALPSSNGMTVSDGSGRSDLYRLGTNGVYSRNELFNEGRLSNNVFTLTFPDSGRWVFSPFDGSASAGKLAQIVDRKGNALSLSYDTAGRLAQIVDDLGRTNTVAYNSSGQLASVTDFSGRAATYQYYGTSDTSGAPGDLKSVTSPYVIGTPNANDFPKGKTTTYTYSTGFANDAENHLLLKVMDGKGQLAHDHVYQHNQTDLEFLRCISATDGTNDPVYFTHVLLTASPANQYAVIQVTVRDALGNVSECSYDARNRPVSLREYTGRAPSPGPVTPTSNRPVNPVRPKDPLFYLTQWAWNTDSLCVQEIEPAGNAEQFVYESDCNPGASPRKKGDLRVCRKLSNTSPASGELELIIQRIAYNPNYGSPAMSKLPAFMKNARKAKTSEAVTNVRKAGGGAGPRVLWGLGGNLDLNTMGAGASGPSDPTPEFATSYTDPRGNVTTVLYDAQGNRVKVKFPWLPGTDKDFAFNTYGQLTAVTNVPDGNGYRSVDTYSYATSGASNGFLLSWTVDTQGPTVMVTSYEYDSRGNVLRCVDPRTNDWLFTYNALDQVVQSSSPQLSGSGSSYRIATQYFYDAANNLTQNAIENRDSSGTLGTNAWWRTQFVYDQQNRLSSCWRDKKGNLVLRCTETKYDANDNIVLFRSGEAANGNDTNKVVQYVYDERNLPYQTIRAPGTTLASTMQWDYDANGNPATQRLVDDQGILQVDRQCTYDGFDRCVTVTDALGNVTTCAYDACGNIVSLRHDGETNDVAGSAGNLRLAETHYTYDSMDRLTQSLDLFFEPSGQLPIGKGGSSTTYTYAPNGQCLSVIDDNGHTTTYTYDTAGRPSSTATPGGKSLTQVYRDLTGNTVACVQTDNSDVGGNPQVFTRTNVYDSLNRCIGTSDNVGNTTQYGYDSRGNLVRQVNPNGNLTGWTYDGLNRCTLAVADLDGDGLLDLTADAAWSWSYDDNDCLLTRTDDNTNSTVYVYDALDRCVSVTQADGTSRNMIWSPRSNLIVETDANGTVVSNRYDLLSRCVGRNIVPSSAVATTTTFELFAYDGCSRPVLASNDVSQLLFAYDSLGNTEKLKQDCLMMARTFDGVGNCVSLTYPGGRMVQYTYDALDQVASLSTSASGGLPPATLATYAYDGPGRLTRLTRANTVNTRIFWTGMSGVANASGDFACKNIRSINHASSSLGVKDQRLYAYDHNQNKVLRAQTTPFVGNQPMLTNTFTYTPLDQLSKAINTKGTGAVVRGYHLDSLGNFLDVTNGTVVSSYTRDASIPPGDFQMDQYTTTPFGSELHDHNGNLVQVTTPTKQTQYSYDYANRLVSVTDLSSGLPTLLESYSYDVLGDRISKTTYPSGQPPVTVYYLRGGGYTGDDCDDNDPILETHSGGPAGPVTHSYCWSEACRMGRPAINTLLCSFGGTGSLEYYYHADELGNVLALTDASGNVLERYEYDDYGAPQFLTSDGIAIATNASPVGNPFLFQGMEWDVTTALYCEGSKGENPLYESPNTARYISRGHCADGFNTFSFQNNNPWTPVCSVKWTRDSLKGTTKTQGDFILANRFSVEIDGVVVGGFHTIGGSDTESDIVEYKDGEDGTTHTRPGNHKPGKMKVTKDWSNTSEWYKWRKAVLDGKVERKSMSVIFHNDAGEEAGRKTGTVKFFNESKGFGIAGGGHGGGGSGGCGGMLKQKPKDPPPRPKDHTGHVTLLK
jgi:phage tail-like protein